MIFRNLFRKSTPWADFSFLRTDIHNHILPAIDDGAQDIENSQYLIHSLQSLGFESLLATPHIISDLYPNNPTTIQQAYAQLPADLQANIRFAAEYMVDFEFEKLVEADHLLSFGNRYVLIEMSYIAESKNLRNVVFDLKVRGYQPILAHPERYNFYHKRDGIFKELKDAGCLLQLNLLSVSGYYGPNIRSTALRLLQQGLYDFAGTDAHHERHIAALKGMCSGKEIQLLKEYPFQNNQLELNK